MTSAFRRHLVPGVLLAGALLASAPMAQQRGATPELPLTHAPIGGLDQYTVALGQFENTQDLASPGGSTAVKTTNVLSPQGIFGSIALRIHPENPGVAIHELTGFDPDRGTIEMWVNPSFVAKPMRQYLFSLEGRRSLDGDAHSDLIVGETNTTPSTNDTLIYFGTPTGLDLVNPTTIETMTTRGIGMADFDGDGHLDLVVSNNQADTLAMPQTTALGEIHRHDGPIVAGQDRNTPDVVYEFDEPQGLAVADFDQEDGPDFVAASYRPVTPALFGYSNDGLGALAPTFATLGAEHITSGEGVAVGDVNLDGVLDVLYGSFAAAPSWMMIGFLIAGEYGFSNELKTERSNETLGVSIGDVTGDGWPDAVLAQPLYDNGVGQTPGRIAIHVNDGAGRFSSTPEIRIKTPRPFTVSATKDIDNDGHLDILVANWRFGPFTSPTSIAYLGPFAPGAPVAPPKLEFLVNDGVATAMGDLDGDGIDDVFIHSSTDTVSPVFLLDENGVSKAGQDGLSRNLPSYTLPTLPTAGNIAGEGAGAMVAQVGGTTTYGTHLDTSNSFELYVEDGDIIFAVTDDVGVRRAATAPFPGRSDPDIQNGFHHIQAQWDGPEGLIELRVGHPDNPLNVFTSVPPVPFDIDAVSPVFRLASDPENQRRPADWRIDDVRISNVVRSNQDADLDGWEDDWDNCPQMHNPDQADWNDDGVGDGCRTCQPDLGVPGAGTFTITLCGEPLHRGAVALLTAGGAPPGVPVLLLTGPVAAPRPFRGGMLVPSPVRGVTALRSDAFGRLEVTVPGGTHGSETEVVILQAVAPDASLPGGIALSNALAVERLP
jgi:hypothetical protein